MEKLTTKQMELLLIIAAVTEYIEVNIDADISLREIVDSTIKVDEQDYEYLEECGYIEGEHMEKQIEVNNELVDFYHIEGLYQITTKGKQYIKLFNEYCKNKKDEAGIFCFIASKEIKGFLNDIGVQVISSIASNLVCNLLALT